MATAAAVSAFAIGCASSVGSPQINGQGGNGGNGGGAEVTAVEATGIIPPTDAAAGWDQADSCKMVQAVWAAFATNYTRQQPDPSGAFYGLNNDLTSYVGYVTGQLSVDIDTLSQQAEALYTADVNGGSASAQLTSDLTQAAAVVGKDCGITLSLS